MTGLTDVHVHLAALPTRDNGCLMSRRMRNGAAARLAARIGGGTLDQPELVNETYLRRLEAELGRSKGVARAVLLGLDGVYDGAGKLDEGRTHVLISNEAVFAACDRRPDVFLPGVSINPRRRDAGDELERCAARGAVLVKFLPNIQGFDPADRAYRSFYRAMARLRLPLLSHVGCEYTLIAQDQRLGGMDRLRTALEEGVTVIAAHGSSSGRLVWDGEWPALLRLIGLYRNLYCDVSALTLWNRVPGIFRISRHPELFDRLLFGTDYPLPVFAWPALAAGSWPSYRQAKAEDNRFDRYLRVLEAIGVKLGADFGKICRG
jgi:hypothetical protein